MAEIIGDNLDASVARAGDATRQPRHHFAHRQSRGSRAVSSRRVFATLASGCLLAAALIVPAAVFAAVAAPDAGGNLDLQTWPENGKLIIVTSVTVPEAVKLPVAVRVPVPEGATVQWAGEILGGEVSADPARPYKVMKSPVGGQYAELTLEVSRRAQVDSEMPALTVNGDFTSASFDWIQSVASSFTSFSVRVPANASDAKILPQPSAQPEVGVGGERLYAGDPINLQPGRKQTVTFSFLTTAASPGASAGGLSPLVAILSMTLGIAIVVLIVLVVRQRQASTPTGPPRRESPGASARGMTPDQQPKSGSASDDDWGFDDEG